MGERRSGRCMTAIALAFLPAACGRVERPSAPQPRSVAGPSERETQACYADLKRLGVRFTPVADRDYGNGCATLGTVRLDDIGVPVTGLTAVRCGAARAFVGWVRSAVAPAAYQVLGSELARVDGMGSYSCRNVIGSVANANKRSGHAIANAVDIGGVVLRDGRRISILNDWRTPDLQVRAFLQTIHASACRRFGTVLSPDYNAAHANHLHLEDDRANFCR